MDPRLYSNLHTFQRESAKLLLEAEQNIEDDEEEKLPTGPDSSSIACRFGSIVYKAHADSTNHYLNMPVLPNAMDDEQTALEDLVDCPLWRTTYPNFFCFFSFH